MAVLRLPPLLLGKARALGAAGERWLRELPATLEALRREWELELGEPFAGGSEAYVVPAGPEAVLKVELPGDGLAARVAVLEAADGRGYARLLRHDAGRRALLLERLEPFAATLADVREALREAWQVRVDHPLASGADKARALAAFVEETWHELGRPCPRAVVERALDSCASRAAAHDPGRSVVVHGDAHAANLLRRADGTHAFVDPEPFLCEPAYDLAVALRLGAADGVPDDVREWHCAERVSTGLLLLRIGADELGRAMLV